MTRISDKALRAVMDEPLLPCVRCKGLGHMNDSHDMDDGYGRWWKSTPTKCEWCNGKGAAEAVRMATLETPEVLAEIGRLQSRLKERRKRLRELNKILTLVGRKERA